MADIVDPASRLEALLDAAEPRIAAIFRQSVATLRASLNLEELADLIEQGRWADALDNIQDVASAVGLTSNAVFLASGQSTAAFLTSAGVGRILFDVANTLAVQAMQANTLRLVTNFTEEQRTSLRGVMVEGVSAGLNPRAQARAFRDSVGLTPAQASAVINYRRLLTQAGNPDLSEAAQAESLSRALRDGRTDRSVRSAIQSQKPLTQAQIDMMVTRYSERYVKYRSEVIGRTEALRSVHEGTEEAYRQAIERGDIEAAELIRRWSSSRDNRVRDSHEHLEGEEQPWGGIFHGIHGDLRYPGDPEAPAAEVVQCRCLLTTRLRRAKG